MKRNLLLVMLAIAVSVSMLAAATWAWFTDREDAGNAVFTAGTVDVTVDGELEVGNWNPGDENVVNWTITNTGSKRIVFRVLPEAKWEKVVDDVKRKLNHDNITIKFVVNDKVIDPWEGGKFNGYIYPWLVVRGDGYTINDYTIYYIGEPLATDESETLSLKVIVDGPKTDNKYQGATFTLGGKVEAVQASNGAPNSQWGVDYYDYLLAEDMPEDRFADDERKEFVKILGDGNVSISMPELTSVKNEDGFIKQFVVLTGEKVKGRFAYKHFTENSGVLKEKKNIDFNFFVTSEGPQYAYLPFVIDLSKFEGLSVTKVVINGVERSKVIDSNKLFVNFLVAENSANPYVDATLETWNRTPETDNLALIYFDDGSIYKVKVSYTHE